jgi:hypothetical protein
MNLESVLQIVTANASLALLSHLRRRGEGRKLAEPARLGKLDKEKERNWRMREGVWAWLFADHKVGTERIGTYISVKAKSQSGSCAG